MPIEYSKRYIRIRVRSPKSFVKFRAHDIGRPGHSKRIAGQRRDGTWMTQAFLIDRRDVTYQRGKLVAKNLSTGRLLSQIRYKYKVRM